MVKIPVKYRFAAVFDEGARVIRSCESSGSEHSADLSGQVNSFLEREIWEQRGGGGDEVDRHGDNNRGEVNIDCESDDGGMDRFEFQDSLKKLFDRDNDSVGRRIRAAVELMLGDDSGEKKMPPSPDFKRKLMARLRDRGYDAGLCKSKWEKNGRNPSGNYEYIDVNAGGSRYIIEVFLAGEFTIARPTDCYASLLEIFPTIFVGKPDELKQVTRLMSKAIRKSMRSVDLNVPPWRRLAYMQAKWFGSYKRTTNEVSCRKLLAFGRDATAGDRLVGFVPAPGILLQCRADFDFAARRSVKTGNLAAALNQSEMLL